MRKEPFLSQEQDDDGADVDLGFSRRGELLVNGEVVRTRHKVALSGLSLFLATLATFAICAIAFVMVYRTFVVTV